MLTVFVSHSKNGNVCLSDGSPLLCRLETLATIGWIAKTFGTNFDLRINCNDTGNPLALYPGPPRKIFEIL